MAATPEFKVKKEIKLVLDFLRPDCWYFMPGTHGYGMSGVPDFVGCYHGLFFGIEAKAADGVVSVYQRVALEGIVGAKGQIVVCRDGASASEFMSFLRTLA